MLEVLQAIASLDFSARAPVSSEPDEMNALTVGINMLAEELRERTLGFEYVEARIGEVLGVVQGVMKHDFGVACTVSQNNDDFDALAVGINMMIDDLRHHVGRLETANIELAEKTRTLEQANVELREATSQLIQAEKLSALGELAAGIAHELNQPLNGIKIIGQSLVRDAQRGDLDLKALPGELGEIVAQVNKMALIIDHMRLFTRRTEGEAVELLDSTAVVLSALKLYRQQLKSHGVELSETYEPGLPLVKGNPIRLEQVVVNLATNAFRELEPIRGRERTLSVRTASRSARSEVVIEVVDNGNGIPDHVREKMFQPFFTTREPGKGTGLGLSVAQKIVTQHGGRIEYETELGKGTSFRIVLPAAQPLGSKSHAD